MSDPKSAPARAPASNKTHPDEPIDQTPALHGEEDVPSDGKDPEGEAMIRELPASGGTSPAGSPGNGEKEGDSRAR
ncbi:MAG: hypothetical protein EOO28_12475 [Comamonadaceae bacterium]|nr:MAG: hypothetical protein EOO28_12475 [Comamonadaceae bacterium]